MKSFTSTVFRVRGTEKYLFHTPGSKGPLKLEAQEFTRLEDDLPFLLSDEESHYLMSLSDPNLPDSTRVKRKDLGDDFWVKAFKKQWPSALPDGLRWKDIEFLRMDLTVED